MPTAERRAKEKAKKKPRGKPFEAGNSGGPGRGNRKPPSPAGSELLADLEEAYRTIPTKGEKPGVSKARELLRTNYQAYVTLYARLAGSGAQKPDDVQAAVAAAGPKEEAVELLAERLLSEWESGNDQNRVD